MCLGYQVYGFIEAGCTMEHEDSLRGLKIKLCVQMSRFCFMNNSNVSPKILPLSLTLHGSHCVSNFGTFFFYYQMSYQKEEIDTPTHN